MHGIGRTDHALHLRVRRTAVGGAAHAVPQAASGDAAGQPSERIMRAARCDHLRAASKPEHARFP